MKIFSIKRVIGLAAIYGAVRYAHKHGGAKNALDELLGKAKKMAGGVKNDLSGVTANPATTSMGSRAMGSESERNTGGAFSSAYAGSTGLGGNGTKNHS